MNCFKPLALLLLFLLLLMPLFALGQNYPKKEALPDDYLQRYMTYAGAEKGKYQTSSYLQDTVEVVKQAQTIDADIEQNDATTASAAGELFGYNLFTRGGTTIEIPQNLALPSNYRLGPGDNIIINLWGRVEQEYDLIIDRQGGVFIPKAGEISLWGLTLPQARERIVAKLATIYSDFNSSLTLGKMKSIQVYVFGEVKYPGCYTVNSLSTMFSALYLTGGPTTKGSLRRIKLLRSGEANNEVDLYQFLLFGNNTAAVSLQAGDVIFVEIVGKRVKVSGMVKRPAVYEILGEETITDVITLAGGTLPSAYLEKVRIDRIGGNDAYQILDIDLSDTNSSNHNLVVEDGDEIIVESIYNLTENVICLEGEFRHPGLYQHHENMTISELLTEGGNLSIEAFGSRIDILRRGNDHELSLLTVNPEEVLAGRADLALLPHDRLIAYAQEDVLPEKWVSVFGAVNIPGEYPFYQGMRISDLVFAAGNLRKSAYQLRVELARIDDDGRNGLIYASLLDPEQDFPLRESDRVFVRETPGWQEKELVTIEGEVHFPGKYVITDKMNTLFSLLQRAGGPTEEAFVKGTVYTRETITEDLRRRRIDQIISRSAEIRYDSSGQAIVDSATILRENAMSDRIIVNIDNILTGDSTQDIELAGGDHIYVPRKPAGIQVLGAVPSISTIAYQPSKRIDYYIKQAGGFLRSADKKHIHLIRADGTVVSDGSAKSMKVLLGDAVFVPTKVRKERDWLKIITSTVSIATSVATTIFVIDRL